MFLLFAGLISVGLWIIDALVGTFDYTVGLGGVGEFFLGEGLQGHFYLATLVPSIAVTTRRLHDTRKSGWRQLLFLIPLVGFILWIIWMAKDGDDGPNMYGPNPKTPAGYPQDGTVLA